MQLKFKGSFLSLESKEKLPQLKVLDTTLYIRFEGLEVVMLEMVYILDLFRKDNVRTFKDLCK